MIVWGTPLWAKDSHSWSLCEALTLKHKVFPFVIVSYFYLFFLSFFQQKNYDEADEDCKHGE